jgi:regulator of sirC expression with transglutaminase-like and TPR domain
LESKEIRSLIKLLDDSGDISSVAKRKLLEVGSEAMSYLIEANGVATSLLKERIAEVVHELVGNRTKEQLQDFVQKGKGDEDLEEGVMLLARYGYPADDLRWCSDSLDELARELDSKLDSRYEPAEILTTLAGFFGREKGFRGELEDYYNPENSYVNRVLQKRTGLPITLCTIYILVARRLNIPLSGVGMPGHFLLKYDLGENEIFLDPFRGGKLLSRDDCREFLELTGLGFQGDYLQTVSNQQILERMIRNLMLAYRQKGEDHRLAVLQDFLVILHGGSRV